ncbi:hypothetical protein PUNSTDRAFT_132690 [Punctularia strigosozonata HHB-11173 SS5]|uniref:uncharacterized protein n=1 Tax=Punctularia strigosozonata (strain HHB-11173) TaxID=741275 RepID=UPI0004416F88|nr:uncharacterized protein PUNSTDRAFT_132690 [Punctularia strigosozonata HHB-11173 SS5]EIN10603.1 hypothetical protein PUNSTDRAFT_132690 [Punctularia strigosozonata HHB-11173 SS5]
MRVQHTAHSIGSFPVCSAAFLSPTELVLGGGGGQSRSGIKNKLKIYNIQSHDKLELVDEFELEKDGDAPMSIASRLSSNEIVCGINSTLEKQKNGQNENCRLFAFRDKKLSPVRSKGTLTSPDNLDDYQKVTTISPDGAFVAVAGEHDFALLTYPELILAANSIKVPKADIYDATFALTTLIIATTVNLLIYSLPKPSDAKGKGKLADLELIQTVDRPPLAGGDAGSSFRAARFHPNDYELLFTLSNTVPARSSGRGRSKQAPRLAYVCKWDVKTWKVKSMRKVGDKAATCFDMSANGKLLAYALSDYTVGVLDADTLAPLITILKAHEWAVTAIKFNPTASLLVSGSTDNTVRVIALPENISSSSWSTVVGFIVAILVVLLAILANQMYGPGFEGLKW